MHSDIDYIFVHSVGSAGELIDERRDTKKGDALAKFLEIKTTIVDIDVILGFDVS